MKTGYCSVPEAKHGESSGVYDYEYTVKALGDPQDGKVELQYQDKGGNESKDNADLIIGADGSGSTLRQILLPDVKRTCAGHVTWRGTIPKFECIGRG